MDDEVDGCTVVASGIDSRKCVDSAVKEVDACDSQGAQII